MSDIYSDGVDLARECLWHGDFNCKESISCDLWCALRFQFGKGVYFADMSSKSANYCCTSRKKNVGLLLLCDVSWQLWLVALMWWLVYDSQWFGRTELLLFTLVFKQYLFFIFRWLILRILGLTALCTLINRSLMDDWILCPQLIQRMELTFIFCWKKIIYLRACPCLSPTTSFRAVASWWATFYCNVWDVL